MFDGESSDLAAGGGRAESGWAGREEMRLLKVGQE